LGGVGGAGCEGGKKKDKRNFTQRRKARQEDI
jgi:hypothetical protein